MSSKYKFMCGAAAFLLVTTTSLSVQAGGDAGAFIGGMFASKIMGNMQDRTQAEQQQAYYAQQNARPQSVQQAAPASSTQTTEQKLKELDKLAAGGYITPKEYKAKKQAIIDAM